ncbi:MAG: hypothetical protein Q8K98_13115 [Bacteroidota bacterium]|nr:hypothetical protein [Bacteroidota bacterium]
MPPYEILQEQYILLALLGGTVLVTFLYVAINTFRTFKRKEATEKIEKFPEGITEGHKPIPLFLIILYIAYFLWAIIYVGAVAIWGFNF